MSLRRFSDYFAILASGVSLLTVVLVYQANLMQFIQQYLQFIQQYSDAVITIAAVLIYAVILSVGIYFGRRRKLNRNRLKGLGKE